MSEHKKDNPTPNIFQSIGNYLTNTFSFGPAAEPTGETAEASPQTATAKAPKFEPTASSSQTTGASQEITGEAEDHLKTREGFRNDVYLDSEGKPTAGTGHLMSASELAQYPVGSIVPQSVLDQWLKEDSEGAYSAAYMQAVEIGFENQTLVDALTAVNFQLGTGWNEIHKKTWGYLVDQDWEAAALEAGDSKWYQQTPVRVFDFQRSMLLLAGKPNSYEDVVAFNINNTSKWGVDLPAKNIVNEWSPTLHEGGETGGGEQEQSPGRGSDRDSGKPKTEGPDTGAPETGSPDTEVPATVTLNSNVGLDDDGTTYVGESEDIKKVQQQLVYAGFLPEEQLSRNGEMVSSVDGHLGPITIEAIQKFQSNVLGFSKPDGRVDAGGRTWAKLSKYQPSTDPVPEQGGGETKEGGTGGVPDSAPKEDENPTVGDPEQSDEFEEIPGSVPDEAPETDFESIPASYKSQYQTTRSVGRSASNTAADKSKIQALLRMCGYRTDLIATVKNPTEARRVQLANSIFHFQSRHDDLSNDGVVSPGKATWKKLIVVSYMNSGGEAMSDEQIDSVHNARKGTANDVPSDLRADITNGHMIGIDNSGYLLPTEFHANAKKLVEALETIKEETGNFSISNGYRSPEHNVKIGSTATLSKHVVGIAADIQTMPGYTPATLRTKIQSMINAGEIPNGYIGLYGWGCHYDIRHGV